MALRTYESLPTAAARIGVTVKILRRRIAEGVLPVCRCGRILQAVPGRRGRHVQPLSAVDLIRAQLDRTPTGPTRFVERLSSGGGALIPW